ncbi:uncharacterized protein [Lolium perenne]|uniref:uncharacterized protein n=1 Tax=Lolium perenne TaxID=4522 RepID=UPI003A990687
MHAGSLCHGDVSSIHIDGYDYDRLFTCQCRYLMLRFMSAFQEQFLEFLIGREHRLLRWVKIISNFSIALVKKKPQ